MQNLDFLKTEAAQKDLFARSEFLAKSEELLAGSSFQKALDLARNRLGSIPGDIDARLVLGRALIGLGMHDQASEILAEVRRSLERWFSMLDLLENPVRSLASSADPSLTTEAGAQGLHGDFYTITMAELFINQGHLEMARQVLEGILKINPGDSGALGKLKELKQKLMNAPVVKPGSSSVRELERWLGKLRPGSRS